MGNNIKKRKKERKRKKKYDKREKKRDVGIREKTKRDNGK